jgi:hypothetical protein
MNLRKEGAANKRKTVKKSHIIMYLILLQADFTCFSSHFEKIKRKIALRKA